MRAGRALFAAVSVVTLAAVLVGCADRGGPEPTVPALTYAGAPTDAAPTGPTFTPTTAPATPTGAPEATGTQHPMIDDVLLYAAVGDSEITGEWRGGCRTSPAIGVSGMTWRGSNLPVADGRTIADVTIEVSIRRTSADGTLDVQHWSASGVFADGQTFDSNWEPGYRVGWLDASVADGVYTLRHSSIHFIDSFEIRAYCD